jgi:ABC-type nitrate/sulfonate/bicarbonate transport system permease component
MLPPLPDVALALGGLLRSGELVGHISASLQTVMLGYGSAVLCGLVLGTALSQSRALASLLTPAIDALRPIAALSFFPLLILLFGIGQTSKAIVIFWTAWPPVLLATVQSIGTVDPSTVEAAHIDGASPYRTLRHIALPLALPGILTGMRIGMSGGWIGLVSAEMLGSSAGLGHAVLSFSQSFQFPQMYAVIGAIALCGLALNQLLLAVQVLVERKVL